MTYNFTFQNPNIKSFFEGSGPPPVSELVYVHEHPLLRPNFLTELDALVVRAGSVIESKNLKGFVIEKLQTIGISLGTKLPTVTRENAVSILEDMRSLYNLCNSIVEK